MGVPLVVADLECGDVRMYFAKCRCPKCMDAYNQYRRNITRQKAYGRWQPFVDAEPVRAHVQRVMGAYSCGAYLISYLSGVHVNQIHHLLGRMRGDGRAATKLRTDTAERLMSFRVSLDDFPPKQLVSSVGSLRRLHALGTVGWPRKHIADRYGLDDNRFSLMEHRPRVTVDTARVVRRIYEELRHLDPEQNGVSRQTAVTVRNRAADRGWLPPHCWDDDSMDYEDTIPNWTGMCGTWQGYSVHRRQGMVPACPPCTEAERKHRAELKAARLAARSNPVGL